MELSARACPSDPVTDEPEAQLHFWLAASPVGKKFHAKKKEEASEPQKGRMALGEKKEEASEPQKGRMALGEQVTWRETERKGSIVTFDKKTNVNF